MKHPLSKSALILSLLLTGCQSTPKLVEEQQAQAQATEHYLNAQSHLEQLESRFSELNAQELSRFAPDQVKEAKEALEEAQEEFDDIRYTPAEADEGDVEDILLAVNQANTALNSANLIRQTAEKELAPTLEMMQILGKLEAASYYAREMKRAESTLEEMLEDVSDGDLEDAREEQAELLLLLQALEVKTVEKRELSSLAKQLDQMKRNRLAKVVPISFQGAVASLEMAKAVIAADPRNTLAIDQAVTKAEFELDHSRHIAQQVTHLRAMDSDDFEAFVLRAEGRLHKIAQALDGIDRRNLAQDDQAESVTKTIAALKQAMDAQRLAIAEAEAAKAVQAKASTKPAAPSQETEADPESEATVAEEEASTASSS
ncbi:hypothetical protein [Ferrimonas sp. YFM]|uniref:hypothetical protein n=1 Tax=Ferrimonas sp. YFM TaxID=3028878 RepID=UPI0025733E87|nr:hypothetical protein [Ferrimonas sp. YFM]BDY04735.1 hypothetical protein F0521_17760 [Ferrimonas sp. YFM]